MTPESVQMLFALSLGFAFAGMCSSAYRVFTTRLPSFSQLSTGPGVAALAAVPLLIVSAPFLIMRKIFSADGRKAAASSSCFWQH
ncbi:MAG: hypothetical protein WA760_08460 [Pseudolabrys sp.]